jgi:spore coat protein U-like protein
MTRVLLAAYCALLSLPAWAQGARAPAECPAVPAQCQINAPVFNFGRAQMSAAAPPVHTNGTISVTCSRLPQDRLRVEVQFELKGVVAQEPPRSMRDQIGGAYLAYDLYVDAARTRFWGDGAAGSDFFSAACFLDEKNRACTIPFVLYGKVNGQQVRVPPGPYLGAVVSRLEYRFANCQP